MIDAGLRLMYITFLDGNMFRQVTMSWTSNIFINLVNILYCMEWHLHLIRSLIVHKIFSMSSMCSFVAHVCICAGDKKAWRGLK